MPETVVANSARVFARERHLVDVPAGEWRPMFDENGHPLRGIRGKAGAWGPRDVAGLVAGQLGARREDVIEALTVLPRFAENGASRATGKLPPANAEDALVEELGIDLIELLPGSNFPLHRHPGDHILIGRQGAGTIRVDGTAYPIYPGVTVFVAAEQEHGVGTHRDLKAVPAGWSKSYDAFVSNPAFQLWAIGVPHKHVEASDRMLLVDDPGVARDRLADEG